jgi:hypothetical protein
LGEIGVDEIMTLLASSPVINSASLAHRVWDRRLPEILLDAVLVLVGIAASVGICRSFMDWLQGPPDSAALTAMAMLVSSIMSVCWSVRYILLETILPPLRAGKQWKSEEH